MIIPILVSIVITSTSPSLANEVTSPGPTVALSQSLQPKRVHPALITVIAPEMCAVTGAIHSVCGEVGWNGPLGPGGTMDVDIILPAGLSFPNVHYIIQATSNWDVLKPPQTCVYTGQPVSPTAIQIYGTGCTLTEFAIGYSITGN